MPLSDELKAIYVHTETAQTMIETVTLSHSRFARTYYLTNDFKAWRFWDKPQASAGSAIRDFDPLPFIVSLPKQDGEGVNEMQINFANADLRLMEEIEAAISLPGEPIKCLYQVYRDIDEDEPQYSHAVTMDLTDIQATLDGIACTATRFNVLGRTFPRVRYNLTDFPALEV